MAGRSLYAAEGKAARLDVVKILNLSCPVCRAAESQDPAIARVVQGLGGRFVWAPVPVGEDANGSKERVYYAARDLSSEIGNRIKQSLYKGIQDMGISLNDYMPIYTWLQQDVPDLEPRFDELFRQAQSATNERALGRAVVLANTAGVQMLPGYIILLNGQVESLVDPSSTASGTVLAMRDELVARIQKYSKR